METVTDNPQKVIKVYDKGIRTWKFVRKDKEPFKSIELIGNLFQKLGLSKNEIRVYVHLARSKERKASEISEALNLHRTETYRILRDLEKRGLVSSVFEKPLKFIAIPFERAIDILIGAKKLKIQQLERRKEQLIDVWMSLPQPQVKHERKEVFQILEGEDQIDLKANELVQNLINEIDIFTSEDDLARLYHSGFIDKLERLPKKYKVRLLTTNSPKSRFFINKINLANAYCAPSDVKKVPTFILADKVQLLLVVRKYNPNTSEKSQKSKIAALWTNYEAFINALSKLFSEMTKTKSSLEIVCQS